MNDYKEAFERIKTFCNSDNGYPYNQYLQSSTHRNADLDCIEKALEEHHKAVWHKVADGDLPKFNELVLCLRSNRYDNRFITGCLPSSSRTILWDLSDNDDTYESINSVVAWTELPKYEE